MACLEVMSSREKSQVKPEQKRQLAITDFKIFYCPLYCTKMAPPTAVCHSNDSATSTWTSAGPAPADAISGIGVSVAWRFVCADAGRDNIASQIWVISQMNTPDGDPPVAAPPPIPSIDLAATSADSIRILHLFDLHLAIMWLTT